MTKLEKIEKCREFFDELYVALADRYELMAQHRHKSWNFSSYLYPNGTEKEITFSSKPNKSFRFSDYWCWYSDKNPDPTYIQCESVNMPWAYKRTQLKGRTKPIYGVQIGLCGKNGKYHCVFGEYFDRESKTWHWRDNTVENILKELAKED